MKLLSAVDFALPGVIVFPLAAWLEVFRVGRSVPRQQISQTESSHQFNQNIIWDELSKFIPVRVLVDIKDTEVRLHISEYSNVNICIDCVGYGYVLLTHRMELVKHTGGCHCGAVRFEVWSSPDLHVFECKYGYYITFSCFLYLKTINIRHIHLKFNGSLLPEDTFKFGFKKKSFFLSNQYNNITNLYLFFQLQHLHKETKPPFHCSQKSLHTLTGSTQNTI